MQELLTTCTNDLDENQSTRKTRSSAGESFSEYSKFTQQYSEYICIMGYSFLDIFLQFYRISFILLHMYSTLCFGKSSATLSYYRTLHPSLNSRSHVRNNLFCFFCLRSFLIVEFALLLPVADNLIRSKRESQRDFSHVIYTILRTPAIQPRIIASRAIERTIVDAMTVVESRY